MNFSEKLFELRKKSGLSQEELADKINVSRQTISKWEMNQSSPEMDKLINLSEIFNISIDELVGNERLEESNNEEENKDHIENMHPGVRRRYAILKLLFYILIIYLAISLFKFILLARHKFIVNSFNEENFRIMQTIVTHDDTLSENPSYLTVIREKVGNKFIMYQYNSKDTSKKPTSITYCDIDAKKFYLMTLDAKTKKYMLYDGLSQTTDEEKENIFEYYGSTKPIKELSSISLSNSLNPLVFVNPFTKTIIAISPFNGAYRYEYNKDYLISRIVINQWGSNRNAEWVLSYDYVLDHFKDKTIENPLEKYEYEIVNVK